MAQYPKFKPGDWICWPDWPCGPVIARVYAVEEDGFHHQVFEPSTAVSPSGRLTLGCKGGCLEGDAGGKTFYGLWKAWQRQPFRIESPATRVCSVCGEQVYTHPIFD